MSLLRSVTIGLVVGEVSGDILGAGLMRALRKCLLNVRFVGIAGPIMQSEGMETWYEMEELSIMGVVEIISRLPRILYIRHELIRRFSTLKPDVFVGIDSPDFTLTLEENLKKRGIRTIHYVSPSIWAWRSKRILKIARSTDNILVLMPFEKVLYDQFNVPCQFIGHSLADVMPLHPDKAAARRELGIADNVRCLALLPGSRNNEIKMLGTDFLYCAELLSRKFPGLEVLIPLINQKFNKQFKSINSNIMTTRILTNNSRLAMTAADVALLASGTATLECMLAKCPMVVGYRMRTFTFLLAKCLVKTPWISLPNLLAGRELVKEFVQDACYPENLVQSLISLLEDNNKRLVLQNIFLQLHQKIRCNADEQAANAVLKLINI